MNAISRLHIYFLFIVAGIMSSACGSDDADEPSVEEQQLARLSKTWVIKSASQDGDRTADFKSPDLTLNVSGTFNKTTPKGPYAYAITGKLPTPSPWSAQPGLWTFATDANDVLVRDDGVRIRYVLADKTLTLTFTCATCNEDNGRTNSAEGDWTFVFTAP